MNIVIIGASSAIAEATARLYAKPEHEIFLVARDQGKLNIMVDDLSVRGAAKVYSSLAQMDDEQSVRAVYDAVAEKFKQIDVVLMAHGILPEQTKAEQDIEYLQHIMQVNALSSLTLLTQFANHLEAQGNGCLAFISSVAGDRGRPSNYAYGASKAIVSSFLQGLNARLYKKGVHVLTIKPGFVDTPMTADIANKSLLWAKPEQIAKGIQKAIHRKQSVVYLPSFWWLIMTVIKLLPTFIFKRLSL